VSKAKAKALLVEAHELQEQGSVEGRRAAMKEPVTERVKQAVQLAPNDPDTLFMATLVLRIYTSAFPDTKRLLGDYQARLDRLGGPSDATLEIAGMDKDSYQRRRSSLKQEASSGCVVTVLPVLLFAFAGVAFAAGV